MPTRASHVGGLATATTERASLMDEPAERAGMCDSAARHGFHPDGAQVGVKGAEGAALASNPGGLPTGPGAEALPLTNAAVGPPAPRTNRSAPSSVPIQL